MFFETLNNIIIITTTKKYYCRCYSQTCEQRSHKGETEFGLSRQVVFSWRFLWLVFTYITYKDSLHGELYFDYAFYQYIQV